jgi:hypothetical protein
LKFGKADEKLASYVDSDFTTDFDERMSLTGYMLTVVGCVVSWKLTSQLIVARFATEAEYVAIVEACKEYV